MFKREQRDKNEASRPAIRAEYTPPTLLQKLKAARDAKANEVMKLNAELVALDAQVAWLERFPQVEHIIEALRNRP